MTKPTIFRSLTGRARTRLAASLLAVSALPLCALAADEGRHGAIAYSAKTGGGHAYGIAFSADGQSQAAEEAVAECRNQGGNNCAQVGGFRNACGALAVGGTGFGAGWGSTEQAAQGAITDLKVY